MDMAYFHNLQCKLEHLDLDPRCNACIVSKDFDKVHWKDLRGIPIGVFNRAIIPKGEISLIVSLILNVPE